MSAADTKATHANTPVTTVTAPAAGTTSAAAGHTVQEGRPGWLLCAVS